MGLFNRKAATPKPVAPRDATWEAIRDEIDEVRERTALWPETRDGDGLTEHLADRARRAVEETDR